MTTRKPMLAAALAAALIALAGCGSADQGSDSSGAPTSNAPTSSTEAAPSATNGSAAPSSSSEMAMITIKDYKYSGADSVSPGVKVMVMNEDTVNHTVTAENKSDFDVTVKAGESATFTAPTKPGTYKYHCTFHSNMMGTLVVK